MQIPEYFLKRPTVQDENTTEFGRLYDEYVGHGTIPEIDYSLTAPKWQFLCFLCDKKNLLLHGSSDPSIVEFEPRQSRVTSTNLGTAVRFMLRQTVFGRFISQL